MNFWNVEVVTPPTHLPVSVNVEQEDLARAVIDELERAVLWRAIVSQERKIEIDGPLPSRLELEPVSSIVSLTRWTPTDDAVVVDSASYHVVTRDPAGHRSSKLLRERRPGPNQSEISEASRSSTECGWEVSDVVNRRTAFRFDTWSSGAVSFRAGCWPGRSSKSAR